MGWEGAQPTWDSCCKVAMTAPRDSKNQFYLPTNRLSWIRDSMPLPCRRAMLSLEAASLSFPFFRSGALIFCNSASKKNGLFEYSLVVSRPNLSPGAASTCTHSTTDRQSLGAMVPCDVLPNPDTRIPHSHVPPAKVDDRAAQT